LCLPLKPKQGGGVYSFTRTFRNYLDSQAYDCTTALGHSYDVLLVSAWTTDYRSVRQARRWNPNVRVIHRVDGSAKAYGRSDDSDDRLARINTLADVTVFQSEFSRWVTTVRYPLIKVDGPTIYNPVDTLLFTPNGEKFVLPPGTRVCNATWSTNRMKGTWQLPTLVRKNPDIQFILCGRYEGFPDLPNLHLLGIVDREEMACVMRSCDVFINLSLNDPCPNVVIEALSSGLPVLYADSGGVPELVEDAGLPATLNSFRRQLDHLLSDLSSYRQKARERAVTRFGISTIGAQYLEVIESLRR
jgi:glycosyltransferase involved in cell wall biosynthesis